MPENNTTGQLNIPEELENSSPKKDDRKPFDIIASESLVELYRQVNKHTDENEAFRKNLQKQEEVLNKQQKAVKDQEEKLREMIAQQTLTDKAVKILTGLVVGAVIGIVLLIAGIVYDIVRDNKMYELLYIDKVERMQK